MSTTVADAETARLIERSLVYRLLARAYRREPDEAFLAELRSPDVLAVVRAFSQETDSEALRTSGQAQIDELAVEFCRLFIGPGPGVPPYESVHRGEPENAGRLWGDATVEVKKFVQLLGLGYANDFHEMPDHLSVECELMYRLLDAEAEALRAGDCTVRDNARRAQRVLYGEHLRLWVPAFCRKLKAATADPFFRALASFTRDFSTSEEKLYAAAQSSQQQLDDSVRSVTVDLEQRSRAAEPFGPDAIPALIQTLHDEDEFIRHAAAEALGRIGAPAVPALTRALEQDNSAVRAAAALAFGQMGREAEAAIPNLRAVLHEKEAAVSAAAAESLKRIQRALLSRGAHET